MVVQDPDCQNEAESDLETIIYEEEAECPVANIDALFDSECFADSISVEDPLQNVEASV